MTSLGFLERFDQAEERPAETLPAPPELTYEDGVEEGRNAILAQQNTLREDLVEKIRQDALTYSDARQSVLKGLEPLFDALVQKLLPDLVPAIEKALIVEHLMTAAIQDTDVPIRIGLPASDGSDVYAQLKTDVPLPIEFEISDDVREGEILLGKGTSMTSLNVAETIDQITKILEGIMAETTAGEADG